MLQIAANYKHMTESSVIGIIYRQDTARIEAAFRKYFHRADVDQKEDTVDVIVCHANVIRYFVCR